MAIDPDINYTRYDVPRAGLKLFSRHSAQFKTQLADDYQVDIYPLLFSKSSYMSLLSLFEFHGILLFSQSTPFLWVPLHLVIWFLGYVSEVKKLEQT